MQLKPLPTYTCVPVGNEFTVMRDVTPLQTPRSLSVTVPYRPLAEAIVAECRGQEERLDLRQMPMTQMTLTAIDIASHHREEVIQGILRHGETELICQRASEPPELVLEQNKTWQRYLDWVRETFGVELQVGTGVVPFRQEPEAIAVLKKYVLTKNAFELVGLSEAVGICGSLVLGLALETGHSDPNTLLTAAELDSLWQTNKWGNDPVISGRHSDIKRDLEDCRTWFNLIA